MDKFDKSPYDPEEVVSCPYFESHVMPAKRLPYHLKKCHEVKWCVLFFINIRDMVEMNM